MPTDLRKARELFLHAVGKLPPEEWEGYVAEACGGDADLEQQVGCLLQVHREAGSFLDAPAPGLDATLNRPLLEKPGAQIGPYKLLQRIGEGGMGVVWMAEQTEPMQRKVALKVIKPGMNSREVLARFEAERQALALMDHPNIAKVLDAGTTDTGRPYFVIELIRGVPITTYCDERQLTPNERLELFVPVCQAVQHAHQKGIIHRDLKPSNVLIALYDDKPVPKVIDFGVAKATGPKLTEATLFTGIGSVVGTVEYMSPEQAGLNQLDIDTRSDIYSLGVVLYELLTGTTPLEPQRVKKAVLLELLRLVREDEPPKPSTRLSTIEQLPSISANRGLEPKKLSGLVRGDLDWIVMKALEKDRDRRYDTANAFARDIQRHLVNEPVEACPPSKRYRFGRFARRNKAALLTTAIVMFALVLGTVISTWQAIRAYNAETQANTSAQQARNAADSERKAKEAETVQRKRAEGIKTFLESAFHSPDSSRDGRTITVVEILDRSAMELQDKFADDPRTKAELLGTNPDD